MISKARGIVQPLALTVTLSTEPGFSDYGSYPMDYFNALLNKNIYT